MTKSKYLYLIMAGMILVSCEIPTYHTPTKSTDNVSSEVPVTDKYEEQSSLDSLAIGDIYLGIDESTFIRKRNEFLINNPTINGIEIDKMEGHFYKGKLYYLRIVSVRRGEEIASTTRYYTQAGLDSLNNSYYVWSSIYKEKYPNAEYEKNYGSWVLKLKKGRCTIEVHDKTSPDYTPEEMVAVARAKARSAAYGLRSSTLYCSRIEIYDEQIIKQKERDINEHKKQNASKSMDII